ncbi:hypothetical protein [Marinifilum fragile]|uniref:ORC-CDC6 family AAA ATPase n=1 Tax=Marinifilum fragile TaxID=570161 RepID=UPI002AAABE8F|nr:hypothetical protein [Marinifilum fragile]
MERFTLDNPFSVTKATEFTDIQINEYWVDYNFDEKKSIHSILNPNEFLPKYILGGKGCGKTHILRYFSYPLQKIRFNDNIEHIIEEEKYIGVYSVLDGLISSRFSGKGIEEDQWKSLFEYYFELYICDKLLDIICDLFKGLELNEDEKVNFIKSVSTLILTGDISADIDSINELKNYLGSLRRKIDFEIVNAPFTRSLNYEEVKILFSPGDLLFGIPQKLVEFIPKLKDVKFIYILDEYEKLFEWQKVFINSIVWDKKVPSTFWIGARRYGYTTLLTKSGEALKTGSEFQSVYLDDIIRKNEKLYKKFAKDLFLNRLKRFYSDKGSDYDQEDLSEIFASKFQKYEDEFIIQELKNIKVKELKHVKEIRKKLKHLIKKKPSYDVNSEKDVDILVYSLLLYTDNDPLEQKYKLFLFYQRWSKLNEKGSLKEVCKYVNSEYLKYRAGEKSDFTNIKEKFKKDFIAQLTSENKIKNSCYSGVDQFIDISWGNPRVFLLILKLIIEKSKFRGEKPLELASTISLGSQFQGVFETSKWFYEDSELIGSEGKNLDDSINKLADILMLYRFSDKPTETSVSAFNYNMEDVSEQTNRYVKLASTHSLLIEVDTGRKEKNSGRKEKLYQLNKTLAPLWNLPTFRRGTVSVSAELMEAIFNPDEHENFERLYREVKKRLNAPTFCSNLNEDKGETEQPNLFNQK